MTTYRPDTIDALAAIIRDAAATGQTLAVTGSGSRPGIGPGAADAVLDVTGIGGQVLHDPAELLLTVPASAPLAEVEALLARAGQCLAFEPPSPDPIWGRGGGTIGGAIAAGLSGSRRPFAGAARDHVLGITGVTGRGEIFKAGGKVLKNVTGFDLPRLLTGSRGTLAVLTELTLKVLPLAPAQATLRLPAGTAAAAVRLMADALMVDGGMTGAAWNDGQVLLRLEASAAVLPALIDAARRRLPAFELVADADSRRIWADISSQNSQICAGSVVWRCPVPASRVPALAGMVAAVSGRVRLDWGGALAWIFLPPEQANLDVHALVAQAAGRDGHAQRMRLPPGITSTITAAPRIDPGIAALSARVKAQFDPAFILSPAAMPGASA